MIYSTLTMSKTNWWKTFFDEKYLETYLHEFPDEQTVKQANFIIKSLQLTPKDKILDLACGYGRHSVEFAKRGYHVTGIDYSQVLLDKAIKDAKNAGLIIPFMHGTMKNLPFKNEFTVVLMLFTAFGYFSHEENMLTLQQVTDALKPNGRFLLDVLNANVVVDRFKREGKQRKDNIYEIIWTHQMSGTDVHEIQELDVTTLLEHTHREWEIHGVKRTNDFYLQHYTLDQYKEMFTHVGLTFEKVWGDYEGNPQNISNWRAIIMTSKN